MKFRFILFVFWVIAFVIGFYLIARPNHNAVMCFSPETSITIVIDAGHGGEDGGAVSYDGKAESSLNWAVSQKTDSILAFCGVASVMTRSDEEIIYPEECTTIRSRKRWDQNQRIELVNSLNNPILISIHQNFYPSSGPKGAQVLYGSALGSEALAQTLQNALITNLQPDNKRSAAPIGDNIYLMRKVNCPAVLVECGFLSNPEETNKLTDAGYQTKLALIISVSALSYCCGVTYES